MNALELLFAVDRVSVLLLGVGLGMILTVAAWAVSRQIRALRRRRTSRHVPSDARVLDAWKPVFEPGVAKVGGE